MSHVLDLRGKKIERTKVSLVFDVVTQFALLIVGATMLFYVFPIVLGY